MSNSVPQWNPSEVLKIESIFTCSGWAHSKGRKCWNRIAKENRELATEIMEDMALLDVRSTNFRSLLKRLAKPLLCRAYHVKDPEQHTSLQRQWAKHIEAYKIAINARQTQTATRHELAPVTLESLQQELASLRWAMAVLTQRTGDAATIGNVPSAETPTPPAQTSRVHTSADESPNVRTQANRSQHTHQVSRHGTQNVTTDAATSTPQDRVSAAQSPRQGLPTSPSPNGNTAASPTSPANLHIPETTVRDHIRETPPSVPLSVATPATAQPGPEEELIRHTEDHGRRAIQGDCSICCEDLQNSENISWCKAQCGQNFHADCVGVWLATFREDRGTCPYCRATWVD